MQNLLSPFTEPADSFEVRPPAPTARLRLTVLNVAGPTPRLDLPRIATPRLATPRLASPRLGARRAQGGRNAPGSCVRARALTLTRERSVGGLQPGNETLHSAQRTLITMLRSWAGLILLAADPQVGRQAGRRPRVLRRRATAGRGQPAVARVNLRVVYLRRFGSVGCVQRWAGAGTRTCTHA
jgi:hypothetical protein